MGLVVQQEKTQAEDGGRHEGGETTPTLRVDEHGTGREGGVGADNRREGQRRVCAGDTLAESVDTTEFDARLGTHTHTQSGQGEQGN